MHWLNLFAKFSVTERTAGVVFIFFYFLGFGLGVRVLGFGFGFGIGNLIGGAAGTVDPCARKTPVKNQK